MHFSPESPVNKLPTVHSFHTYDRKYCIIQLLLQKKPCLIARYENRMSVISDHVESHYTCKNAQVVKSLQTSCNKSVHKLSTSCVRTACS